MFFLRNDKTFVTFLRYTALGWAVRLSVWERVAMPSMAERSVIEMAQTTKRALAASLKELLLQKPFHKITISDITQHCGVNRMTFYYHFHDIYDLANWTFEEDAARLLSGRMSAQDWRDGFLVILQELRKNRQMILNICRSVDRETLDRYLCKAMCRLLNGVLDEMPGGRDLSQEDRDFIVSFYAHAITGIILEWADSGLKEEPEALARRTDRLCLCSIDRVIETFLREEG